MRIISLHLTIIISVIVCCATAQNSPPAAAAPPQYFTLNLPAGVSLISAPLNTGPGLARDSFLGLPPQWPLFYGWNPEGQDWVSGDQAQAGLAGGYWVYLPTPATLVVAGQPYSYFTSVNKRIDPGWHFFGVPFQEGVGWKDFKLYASGNPISLDTAVDMGWIDSQVTTTQGSEVQYLTAGQPFLPGVAYWVHTTVPLQLRADRQAALTPASGSSPPPSQSQAASMQSSSLLVGSTSSSVMGWLSSIAGFLGDVCEGAVAIAEGNWAAAGFDFLGGTFGLIEHGLDPGAPDPSPQLTQMDASLDTLIVDVSNISGQLTNLNIEITGLTSYIEFSNALGINLQSAHTWLQNYYLDQTQAPISRNWARWYLAGCSPIVADNPGDPPGCPAAGNPVTTANYNAFTGKYVTSSGTATQTADFPLWWASSVLASGTGFNVGGTNASGFITEIYNGLTNSATQQNALLPYMEWVLSKDPNCSTDVSNPNCDLLNDVYLPTELFFLQAIGYQSQLAEAVVEADGVLAEENPSAYAGSATTFMSGVNQKVNEEVEVFLEVAEQIALYRAADGTQDWNTFGSSDAAQLLARADFVASQLGRQVDPTNPSTAGLTPPWPASGVVGRVFYVDGEPPLPPTGTRVVVCTDLVQSQCPATVPQISEDGSNRAMTGAWPYLLWTTSGSGSSLSATASAHTNWKVQRLKPLTAASLPVGQYTVNSTVSSRDVANLVVSTYDPTTYASEPALTPGGVIFGSFNGLEGSIGKFGLVLGQPPWNNAPWALTLNGEVSLWDTEYTPQISYINPSSVGNLNVVYPNLAPVTTYPITFGDAAYQGSWSPSVNITLPTAALAAPYSNIHVHWPSTINVNLNGGVVQQIKSGDGRTQYYSYIKFDQQVVDSSGNTTGSVEYNQCNSAPFNQCTITNASQVLDIGPLVPAATQYTFKVSFSSEVIPYSSGNKWELTPKDEPTTWRSSIGNSSATWLVYPPMLTLTQ